MTTQQQEAQALLELLLALPPNAATASVAFNAKQSQAFLSFMQTMLSNPGVEVFSNNGSTTLNGAINATQTSIVVTSAATLPTTGNFRIIIDSEVMIVTEPVGTTWTVQRGAEGTTAASHSNTATVTHVDTAAVMRGLQKSIAAVSENANLPIYICDSSGPVFDVLVLHDRNGATSYVLPPPTYGREIFIKDMTGVIETAGTNGFAGGNWIFIVPNGAELFNNTPGYTLTGGATFHVTNGSPTVTATGSAFTTELAPGMSITFPQAQTGVSYIVKSIASDTSLTLTANYTGITQTTATAQISSLAYYANNGTLTLWSDGTNWFASSNKALRAVFTGSGTFIPSPGCSRADLTGWGGGGGGGSGAQGNSGVATNWKGGGGGGGSIASSVTVAVTPNSKITVTIGTGGAGGTAASANSNGNAGTAGGDSTFGTLATFRGASPGGAGIGDQSTVTVTQGGMPCQAQGPTPTGNSAIGTTPTITLANPGGVVVAGMVFVPACGGPSANAGASQGMQNPTGGGDGGAAGANANPSGGGGGGAGPNGTGGAGGAGTSGGVGVAGGNAAANSGAGGGGGGSGNQNGSGGTAGGNGGSGQISVELPL